MKTRAHIEQELDEFGVVWFKVIDRAGRLALLTADRAQAKLKLAEVTG